MMLQSSGRAQIMVSRIPLIMRQAAVAGLLCAAMVGLTGSPAHARVFVGIGIPFYGPGFYPPPAYYPPPPVYYAPPPVVYTPPQTYTPPPISGPAGQSCYAGPYVCPMDRPVATGGGCYCPGNGGQRIWGHAN
ncbi:MAG: hypothetical protein QOF90_1303 [Acetobacteraceae bacterium]|jgi:hypothetical protein|nr:hypothetical protein [Acetobacteraceae bacterium]